VNHDAFTRLLSEPAALDADDWVRMKDICARVTGYSDSRHYAFLKHLVRSTDVRSVLMLGVYCGRDIVFMLDAAAWAGRDISIIGVDKFSDDSCADWPEAARAQSWVEAGFGPAPTLSVAQRNIDASGFNARVQLVQARDEAFLDTCRDRFDVIYIDTSHDYATVRRQIGQTLPLLNPGGLLSGDDYADSETWGVKRAVSEQLAHHVVFNDWIWAAPGLQ
jgi:predicted O-methyltransferase YrrM